ncbi:MAG: TIGR02646 family protein [Magnetococcales bacterium]|nr:TIGR02646 family protein [Magnetococcales bacterium]
MKRCLKPAEPACLQQFRAENPSGSWEDLRNEGRDCYGELRQTLFKGQGGLCAYCEIPIGDNNQQIAHFHPKSDPTTDRNWALHWANLWLACKGGTQASSEKERYLPPLPENRSCDEHKEDRIVDDTVFSPGGIPLYPRLFTFEVDLAKEMVMMVPEAALDNPQWQQKAQATIDTFNLNCPRLCKARYGCWEGIVELMDNGANVAAVLGQDNGCWPRFFTLIRWQFGQAAETYLQAISYCG